MAYEMEGGAPGKWENYVPKVLKRLDEKARISADGKKTVCDLLCFVSDKICYGCDVVTHDSGSKTISSRTVQMITRIILERELAKHAITEATKAVTKVVANRQKLNNRREQIAGLIFPVSRAEGDLRALSNLRVSSTAPVYLAAVLEYLAAEILEISHNVARDEKKATITRRHILLALEDDEELKQLFRNVVIVKSGVKPHIHAALQSGGAREDISNGALKRLSQRAGVKSMGELCYEELRAVLRKYLEMVIPDIYRVTEYNRRVTMKISDLDAAINVNSKNYSELNKVVGGAKKGKRSLKNIKAQQKSVDLIFANAGFDRMVRNILEQTTSAPIRLEAGFIEQLQSLAESYLIKLLHSANMIAINAQRVTVQPKDISLVRNIRGY